MTAPMRSWPSIGDAWGVGMLGTDPSNHNGFKADWAFADACDGCSACQPAKRCAGYSVQNSRQGWRARL